MRVVLNGRFYGQPITGVQRFARGLASQALGLDPGEVMAAIPGLGLVPIAEAGSAVLPKHARRGHGWEQLRLPSIARGGLLVGLCNSGPVRMRNQVVTIHDASPEVVPGSFSWLHRRVAGLGLTAARNAARIITVSEASKLDLISFYDFKPDRIDVVPNGVDARFTPGPGPRRRPYCLFVGAHDPRKNLDFLVDLWPEVERRTGLQLVATGRSGSPAHAAGGGNHEVLEDVGDDELVALYRGAHLLLHPSRYEGFGLPMLEAMACGTPFLSTDVGAAAELATRPERQLLSLEAEAWLSAIEGSVAAPAEDARAWRIEARARAGFFSWERSATLLSESLTRARQELT